MGRRKKGSPVHGWVIVDKPEGITSTQVVGIVKRVFDAQKAGHAGTLDPEASGVLVVLVGEATKLAPFVTGHDKRYVAKIALGTATDSFDGRWCTPIPVALCCAIGVTSPCPAACCTTASTTRSRRIECAR